METGNGFQIWFDGDQEKYALQNTKYADGQVEALGAPSHFDSVEELLPKIKSLRSQQGTRNNSSVTQSQPA
jgi:hypothetical protein